MKSPAWFKRRAAFIKTTSGTCFCGSTMYLHVHHATYARLGRELNRDLRLVCKRHHDMIHKYHKSLDGVDLLTATDDFIASRGMVWFKKKKK